MTVTVAEMEAAEQQVQSCMVSFRDAAVGVWQPTSEGARRYVLKLDDAKCLPDSAIRAAIEVALIAAERERRKTLIEVERIIRQRTLIVALFDELPPVESVWPAERQVHFLRACEAVFTLIYGDVGKIEISVAKAENEPP